MKICVILFQCLLVVMVTEATKRDNYYPSADEDGGPCKPWNPSCPDDFPWCAYLDVDETSGGTDSTSSDSDVSSRSGDSDSSDRSGSGGNGSSSGGNGSSSGGNGSSSGGNGSGSGGNGSSSGGNGSSSGGTGSGSGGNGSGSGRTGSGGTGSEETGSDVGGRKGGFRGRVGRIGRSIIGRYALHNLPPYRCYACKCDKLNQCYHEKSSNLIKCNCTGSGNTGKYCEQPDDDNDDSDSGDVCDPSPCNPGETCVPKGRSYRCQKPCGLKNPCQNGGTCNNHVNGTFSCTCPVTYTGKFCDIGICETKPCPDGKQCVLNKDSRTGYTCKSPCGPPNSCQNGGTCSCYGDGTYSCSCPHGYDGPNCEHVTDVCVLNQPCMNGGVCVPCEKNDFRCVCKKGFVGERCEKPIYSPCGTHGGSSPGVYVAVNVNTCSKGCC